MKFKTRNLVRFAFLFTVQFLIILSSVSSSLQSSHVVASSGSIGYVYPYNLTIEIDGSGTTDPALGSYVYYEVTDVDVTAIPAADWSFDHWLLDGVDAGDDNPITVTMDADKTLNAVFVETFPTTEYVTVDVNRVVGVNNLSLGFQLDGRDISAWRTSSTLQNLAREANFKIVRWFPQRLRDPCTGWNPPRWDWSLTDDLVNKIFAIGAEPMPVLGFCGSSGFSSPPNVPKNPTDFATYCREWAKHYPNIRYYEIINEPHHGFSSGAFDAVEFAQFYNTAVAAMKAENPNIMVGNDNTMVTWAQGGVGNFRDWAAENLDTVDFLSWHRYQTGSKSESDSSLMNKAENDESGTYSSGVSKNFISKARQIYYDAKGVWLPCIQSEGNLNYAFGGGTDPRIQEMVGAVSIALSAKMLMLEGNVIYNVFFDFGGSGRSDTKFGMVNLDNDQPWYPYYAQKMIASNLAVGDEIVESTSSTSSISSLAWVNDERLNVLLIHKSESSETITLNGVEGDLDYQKIDDSSTQLQTGTINSANAITLSGYTVMHLEQPIN